MCLVSLRMKVQEYATEKISIAFPLSILAFTSVPVVFPSRKLFCQFHRAWTSIANKVVFVP